MNQTQINYDAWREAMEEVIKLKAENERLQAERKGMIDENPGDAYWKTAPHDELRNALLFQGGTTKALLQQTEEQQAEIEQLRPDAEAWNAWKWILSRPEHKAMKANAERYAKWKENGLSYSNGYYHLEIHQYNPDGVEILTADEVADAAREGK